MTDFTVVDVNGLNGSLSYGMAKNGGRLLARTGYLNLGAHIVAANAHLWGDDWEDAIDPKATHDWEAWWMGEKADVVVAVPPCSGFSLLTGKGAGRGLGGSMTAGAEHPSNDCMWSSARYAARHAPKVYMFESVTGAYRQGREVMQGLRAELERISGQEYYLTHWLHDGVTLGAPSSRQRYMFVATQNVPFRVQPVEEYAVETITTVREAIGDLETMPITMSEQYLTPSDHVGVGDYAVSKHRPDCSFDGHYFNPSGKYQGVMTRLHELMNKADDPWRQGESMAEALKRCFDKYGTVGVVEVIGETIGARMIANGFNMGPYCSTREVWNGLHSLIAGGGPIFHVHPTQDRIMTYREFARIQGWPDELVINFDEKKFGKEKLDSCWGKAVMPTVAVHAAKEVAEWLDTPLAPGKREGELIGDREYLIDELGMSRQLRHQHQGVKKLARAGQQS